VRVEQAVVKPSRASQNGKQQVTALPRNLIAVQSLSGTTSDVAGLDYSHHDEQVARAFDMANPLIDQRQHAYSTSKDLNFEVGAPEVNNTPPALQGCVSVRRYWSLCMSKHSIPWLILICASCSIILLSTGTFKPVELLNSLNFDSYALLALHSFTCRTLWRPMCRTNVNDMSQ
jgi:hypothetical protein